MVVAFLFLTEPSGLAFMKENVGLLIYAVPAYLAAGVVWGIVKWWFFVRRIRDRYQEIKDAFLNDRRITDGKIPSDLIQTFKEFCSDRGQRGYHHSGEYDRYRLEFSEDGRVVAPVVNKHKARITSWMVYWPWSAMWTLIDDPIRRLYNRLYTLLRGFYQSIANQAFQSVDEDFAAPKPPTPPTTGSGSGVDGTDKAGGFAIDVTGTPGPRAQGASGRPATARARRNDGTGSAEE